MSQRRRYTDEQRATLISMLISEGYPGQMGALQKVASYAGVHSNVLRRWYHNKQNPAPAALIDDKVFDFKQALDDELKAIFAELHKKRSDATHESLVIAIDKLGSKKLLLENRPTERISVEQSTHITIEERKRRIYENLKKDQALREYFGADDESLERLNNALE